MNRYNGVSALGVYLPSSPSSSSSSGVCVCVLKSIIRFPMHDEMLRIRFLLGVHVLLEKMS